MNAGRSTASFLVTPKKKYKLCFFSAYYNTTESIKQRFAQIYYMIYGSIQNVLAIGTTGRNRRSGQPNCTFLSRRLVKEKMKSPLKVSDVMINARAIAIDSVILFFHGIYLNGKKLPASVVVVLLKLLLNVHAANVIRNRFFAHWKE